MKILSTILALSLSTTPAFALSERQPKPPVEEPETSSSSNSAEIAGGLVALVALWWLLDRASQPPTSNCDTISDQTIYDGEGKPIDIGEVDLCQ